MIQATVGAPWVQAGIVSWGIGIILNQIVQIIIDLDSRLT